MKPKNENDCRSETVRFRVTVDEMFKIDEAAFEIGISRSDYLRRLVFEKEVVIFDFSELDGLTAQIGKIGVNINQIARKLNQGGELDQENAEYLRASLETLHEMIRKIYADSLKMKVDQGG